MTCLSLLEITWKETSLKQKRAKAFNERENDVLTFNQPSHCPLSYFGRALSTAEVREFCGFDALVPHRQVVRYQVVPDAQLSLTFHERTLKRLRSEALLCPGAVDNVFYRTIKVYTNVSRIRVPFMLDFDIQVFGSILVFDTKVRSTKNELAQLSQKLNLRKKETYGQSSGPQF